jgi:hypothetical protein
MSGFCGGKCIGGQGKCGVSAEDIRRNIAEHRVVVLAGTTPS